MRPYLAILVVLVGTALVPVLAENPLKNKTDALNIHTSVKSVPEHILRNGISNTNICGGVLTASSGTISYKNAAYIAANERCIWIIKPNSATGFTLNVATMGLQVQAGQTGITATCFYRRGFTAFSSVGISRVGTVSVPSTCHSLVITFYSGPSSYYSRGFSMSYTTRTGTSGASAGSKYYLLSSSQQQIRHPANADLEYSNNELTMFGFGPASNLYSSARKTLVTYMRDTIGGSCAERIHMYRFTPANGWASVSALCSDVEFKQWEDSEIMLVTFTSDGSGLGRGFHVIRTNLPL
ncbi:hypothetical protein Ocin01_16559 [Orchesella cincta]|uniref:CUB domain-containing protein n=1 Tax=Orchesella cincta TaxID=48709 RepID=A0A1D2MB58_ORCCI|nr:hypothetical protein Ocin01_16559 [Orchesella cincta]